MLQNQGFGTRAYCYALIESGDVWVNGEPCLNPDEFFDLDGLHWQIGEHTWRYREHVYLLMTNPRPTNARKNRSTI